MGLNQQQVYQKTGISADTQRLIENGHREPRIATLERLSNLYKRDLIYLLSQSRETGDLFSDELIMTLHHHLNNLDMKGFVQKMDEVIQEMLASYEGQSDRKNNLEYVAYLKSFRDLDLTDAHYKDQNIHTLEKLLAFFNQTSKGYLEDPNLYELETQIGITLAIICRYNDDFDKSEAILHKIIDRLENTTPKTLRQQDALINATIHLSQVHHRREHYDKVIVTVDSILHRRDLFINKVSMTALLLKKGAALYMLGNEDYKHIFATIMLIETPERVKDIRMRAKSFYGFDPMDFITTPNHLSVDEMTLNEL